MNVDTASLFEAHRSFLANLRGEPGIFGDPDGGRTDPNDFIDVPELRQSPFFSQDSNRVRVVIGRKGSGKTLYLRRMELEIERNDSLQLADNLGGLVEQTEQTQLFGTRQVLRLSHWFSELVLTEVWQLCWGRAIIAATASHLAMNPALATSVPSDERARLLKDFRTILGHMDEPRSPFTTLRAIIHRSKGARSLERHIDDPLWDDLEARVGSLLFNCPPLYFLIDAIDEEFAHAPAYWMRCQKGLFYETMRLLRHSKLGGRLHIIISIRDVVFYSVFRSEHASRYIGDQHIRVLDWGPGAARAFLDEKLARMSDKARKRYGSPTDLREWLGFSSVTNTLRGREDVYDYLLRHTQCLPRDIVAFGNFMGDRLSECEQRGRIFNEDDYRDVVSDVAMLSGLQQLGVVAHHVIADEIPTQASQFGFESVYLSVDEYKKDRLDQVIEIISECGSLEIGPQQFLELQNAGREAFEAPDIGSILWQAGLLGVYSGSKDEGSLFFSFDRMGRLRIPTGERMRYVFHPCMREVAGLRPGSEPVLWY